jgi:hypothetical protein
MLLTMADDGSPRRTIPEPVVIAVVMVVAVVWAASYLAAIFVKGFTPDPKLNFYFFGVVGVVLGVPFLTKG